MGKSLSQDQLLIELLPSAESLVNRHLTMSKTWNPHDYVPWEKGMNFSLLGGSDYEDKQSTMDKVAQAAMITNLLTEDNLPSYHREIAENFTMDDSWGYWVGRWTAEENRHSIAMRDYLVVTRTVDPVKLEKFRMQHMTNGASSEKYTGLPGDRSLLHLLAYVSFQELATRVSHKNTGKISNDPDLKRLLQRIAADENLHMIFYRDLCADALNISPDQTIMALRDIITNFQMPGVGMPDFRRNGVLMAKHGIYDLRQHKEDVLEPILKKWNILHRDDFNNEGLQAQDDIGNYLVTLENQALKFEEMRDRSLAREKLKESF